MASEFWLKLASWMPAVTAAIGAALATPAEAAKPLTWIVVEASNGQVVTEHDADAQNYPASLTKMMTLYIAFQDLERAKLTMNEPVVVSLHASRQAPSKLGLVPGRTITVRELVLGMVTKSANDAAVAMGEHIAGSEAAFAGRMNETARALGMTHTNFRNASGLPNPAQYTTARDMAKLAFALYRDYPREYAFFATESFSYDGRTFETHNHLMEAFDGMDGIKTGYIYASGFNLAASAVRNRRRLIGVIMGGHTAESRDMEMAELLDDGFAHRATPAETLVAENGTPARESFASRAARALSPIATAHAAVPTRLAAAHGAAIQAHRSFALQIALASHHAAPTNHRAAGAHHKSQHLYASFRHSRAKLLVKVSASHRVAACHAGSHHHCTGKTHRAGPSTAAIDFGIAAPYAAAAVT
jgi:D-alanyl-D-alanine carboxypeptidase